MTALSVRRSILYSTNWLSSVCQDNVSRAHWPPPTAAPTSRSWKRIRGPSVSATAPRGLLAGGGRRARCNGAVVAAACSCSAVELCGRWEVAACCGL